MGAKKRCSAAEDEGRKESGNPVQVCVVTRVTDNRIVLVHASKAATGRVTGVTIDQILENNERGVE